MISIDLTTITPAALDALYDSALDTLDRDLMTAISEERRRRTRMELDQHNVQVAADRMARDAATAADAAATNALIDSAR